MRKNVALALVVIALGALIIWGINRYVQPIISANYNQNLVLFVAILGAFMAVLAALKDVIELVQIVGAALSDRPKASEPSSAVTGRAALFPVNCGQEGIDLGEQRLLLTSAFGAYFAGLLERNESHLSIPGQIDLPAQLKPADSEPVDRLLTQFLYPKGGRIIVIAAEGGMGKSTLAARLVKCLYQEGAVELILGDSAKTRVVNPVTGAITDLSPAFYSPEMFYERICVQLGLPFRKGSRDHAKDLQAVRDRLIGRRAIIVADNLETVEKGTELFRTLVGLASRDVRVLVTTRTVKGLGGGDGVLLVHLRPLTQISETVDFIRWHIRSYQGVYSDLRSLEGELDHKDIQRLLDRTGGIPLLIQLVISQVARSSWAYIDHMPQLFGSDLLEYLYRERWDELEALDVAGRQARQVLKFICDQQDAGKRVTFERLARWSQEMDAPGTLTSALQMLQERFLVVNHDPERGNFAIFPSLAQFLRKQLVV